MPPVKMRRNSTVKYDVGCQRSKIVIFVTYSKLDTFATLGFIGQKQRVPGK
jgi:hypothetical protein